MEGHEMVFLYLLSGPFVYLWIDPDCSVWKYQCVNRWLKKKVTDPWNRETSEIFKVFVDGMHMVNMI